MHGIMLVLEANGTVKRQKFVHIPELEAIKREVGGGQVQKVKGFDSFRFQGETYRCLALCNPDGKERGMRTNIQATRAWHTALRATGQRGLLDQNEVTDFLAGPVVVLLGDRE